MRISKYTFLFEIRNKEFFVYNALTNALIEVDGDCYLNLRNAEKGTELDQTSIDKELYDVLLNNGIITESDDDDYLKYKSIIVNQRAQRNFMHLTLAPTMDCCFNCHYCFEKYKEPNYMTPEVMDAIVKYVSQQTGLNHVKITWFGGEPLMAVPQIEKFYDKFSAIWDKSFDSNIITTGYHIDKEAVRVLKKVKVTSVQITLDGLKDTHNSIKYLPSGEDVFSRILHNIELLNDLAQEINIIIRVNLTRENAHEYPELFKLYCERFHSRKNISIAPAFVLDRGASNCRECKKESTLFQHKDRSEFIIELAKHGIDSPYIRYPERFFNECAIRNDMAIGFDPEGYGYKCWEVIGNKEYAIGKINKDGHLFNMNFKILNRQMHGADTIDDPICSQCKYLPICNGGCPIQRIENKYEGGNNKVCTYLKGFLPEFMKLHIIKKRLLEQNEP